jgi:undecaprenyl-diphosphatase
VKITTELERGELDALDRAVLARIIDMRVPSLNGPAVDLTALGSATVLTLVVLVASVLFALARDVRSGLQLIVTGVGAGYIGDALKHVLERQRPAQITRLVQVSSFSYPSAHSMASASVYLTLAILIASHLPSQTAGVMCFVMASLLGARDRLVTSLSGRALRERHPGPPAAGHGLGAARQRRIRVHPRPQPQPLMAAGVCRLGVRPLPP